MVSNNLGAIKLEHVIKEGVFPASKTYGIIHEDDTFLIKAKGIKDANSILSYNDLKTLLFNKDIKINQDK
jgi:hypothetical protein